MGFSTELGNLLTMLDSHTALSHLSQSAAATLITAIWQGAALALCLGISVRLAPRTTASHRFAIWTAGFAAVAALPFLPRLLHLFSGVSAGSVIAAAPVQPWLSLDTRWSILLAGVWVCASLVRVGDLALHTLRLRKLWKSATPVDVNSLLPALAMPGRRTAQLCTTQALERPSVIGFLAPRILIPDWLYARLTSAELDQIMLHETEHLRRYDDWTNLLQKLVLVLFPLNPALVWIERRLCLEREMACDEGVVRRTRAPRAYAACLASLAERGMQHRAQALSLGAWQRRPELARRVHSLLLRKRVLSPVAARSLTAILGCSLLTGTVELSRCQPMIAFASAQSESAQSNLSSAALGDRVFPAAYQPVATEMPLRGQGRPFLTNLKATMPMRQPARPAAISKPTARVRNLGTLTRRAEAPRQQLSKAELLKAELLKAELPAALQPVVQQPVQAQQWIVLTTWEQLETTEPSEQAGQGSGQNSEGSGQGTMQALSSTSAQDAAQTPRQVMTPVSVQSSGQNPGQRTGQITITRLILRVIPASSPSSAIPLRAGWLVFQL